MADSQAPAAAAAADWESCKENFQPLKAGRKASALRDSTAELRTQAIEERRRAFWEELASYTGSDPLDVWLRFIKWTQETFSAGGHKAELLPLLERCTRELQAAQGGRYADDIRYLRLWVHYADLLPDPADVFSYLRESGIGQGHALFYIAHATYLEARGGYARADAVYQQGINVLAHPVERLRAKYQEFQQRMARRIQRKAAEQVGQEVAEPDHPERKSLGVLGGRRANMPAAAGGRGGAAGLLGGAAGFKRKASAAVGAGEQENVPGGGGLDIFVDEEFSGAGLGGGAAAASAPAAFLQTGRSAAAPWNKLTSFEAGRKENVQRAGVWAGQKLKQAAAHSAPAAPALEVFVDPELQELEEQAVARAAEAAAAEAAKPTLRQRLDRGGTLLPEEEILVQNPLHLHKVQAGVPAAPLGGLPGSEAKRRREEAIAFDPAALMGSGGEELCFEEVRAAAWLQRQAEEQVAAAAQGAEAAGAAADDDMELEGDTCALTLPASVAVQAGSPAVGVGLAAAPPADGRLSPVAVADGQGEVEAASVAGVFGSPDVGRAEQPAEPAEPEAAAAEKAACPAAPSPALAAELAAAAEAGVLAEDAGMADAKPPASAAVVEQAAAAEEAAAELQHAGFEEPAEAPGAAADLAAAGFCEPTVTLSSRDAFAAINQMFGGALPADAAMGGAPAPAGYEPTMTIATKAAFDAISQMFKGALPHEHGVLPPTSRGPAGFSDPTVTISTKAAFDAINHMFGGGGAGFGGSQSHRGALAEQPGPQGGFRAPPPRPPRGPAAAPAPLPDSPGGGFCIREDTQFVSVPLGPAAGLAAAEQEAESPLRAGGGGGGGFCIREDTQYITVPAGVADEEEEEEGCGAASPRQRGGSRSPAAAPAGSSVGFCIREDTQFITVPVGAQLDEEEEQGAGGLVPAVPSAGAAPAAARAPAAGGLFGGAGGGFCIREDTQFIAVPAARRYSGVSSDQLSPAGSAGSTPLEIGGGAAGGSCLLPCKRPLSDCAGGSTDNLLDGGQSPRGGAGSPAHSANAMQVNKWGFFPGADDTLALTLGAHDDTQALLDAVPVAAAAAAGLAAGPGAAPADGVSPGAWLQLGMEGLALSDCKENLLSGQAQAALGSGRRLCDPGVAARVLQPLGEARAAALGSALMEGEGAAEAEAALVAAPPGGQLAEQDSFEVFADDGGGMGDSPPLMASPAASDGSATALPAPMLDQQEQQQQQLESALDASEAGFVTPVQQAPAGQQQLAAVDPFSPRFHTRMLACLEPGVSQWPGVYCLCAEEEEAADAGFLAAGRSGCELAELQLCGLEFAVSGCIGEGAYARVYQGVDGECDDVALKREAPACPWEWYICKALSGRVPAEARHLFADPVALLLGSRSSLLVCPLGRHGSLQDLVNAYLARGQAPPESLAMHFAAELLRIMQCMHSACILHADIKPDNLLVTLGAGGAAGDENAGPALGLQLIDFGRGVDLELLPPGTQLQGDSGTDSFRCVEMREGRPWVWQADAYGVAACAHVLLYGQYMEVERVREAGAAAGEPVLRLRQPFKRQWAGELWGAFFHRLLNHTDPGSPPQVGDLIAAFEAHPAASRDSARRLRQDLSAVAAMLPHRC